MLDIASKRVDADIAKLMAQTDRLNTQGIWIPFLIVGAFLSAGAGVAVFIFRITGAM